MRFQAVCFGALVALLPALPVHAQLPRCEGTLTQSGDGAPVRANLFFQPPDSLKIELLDSKNEVAQTVVASGDQTQTFDARSKRLSVLNANIAREWFRGSGILAGGPANFAFTGATGFEAKPDQGVSRVRDRVLLGNDDRRSFYVASKQRVRAFPAHIAIENGVRTDTDDLNILIQRVKVSLDAQKFPTRADVGSGADTLSYVYALKPRADEFPANTFALPDAAQNAMREEGVLRAPSTYRDATPDEMWQHGLAVWRANGDAPQALSLWAQATLANPRATAPRWSSLDVLLATRGASGAARAIEGLKPLVSDADLALATVALDNLRADPKAALADLERAATTGEPDRQLALSLARRSAGDIEGARTIWKTLLAPTAPKAIQVKAAENFALSATPTELGTLGATLQGDGESVQLARALLDLRAGKTTTFKPSAALLQSSLARALERAGQSDAARPLWEALEGNDSIALQNEARAHLVTILARSGDASGALAVWNRWYATLLFDTQKERAQNVLFDAFQKSGKLDSLRLLILNRASGTNAKDLDLRLRYAYEQAFGTDETIKAALATGYDKFSNVAFWQGKRAESLAAQGYLFAPRDMQGFKRRASLFLEAGALLDKAIASSPEPTFYTLQKALIQIQRPTGVSGVIDATDSTNAYNGARAALTQLDASDDPDYRTVAALGWNSFPGDEEHAKALNSAQAALDTAPNDGNRATLIFANRQVNAQILASRKDFAGSIKEWGVLLDIAQSADDEASLVANLLNGMDARRDASGMAQLLVRVASEHWPLDAETGLLNGAAGRVAGSPLLPDVTKQMEALAGGDTNSEAGKAVMVARAALALARLQQANAVVATPGTPPSADAELTRATTALTPALGALRALTEGASPFWGARARLILLDAGTLAPAQRSELLQQLGALQGGEPSVALALANASTDASTRIKVAQRLDFRLETWSQLGIDALAAGDKEGAEFWSREAFEFAVSSPETSANDFQRVAFARARILWTLGQTTTATTLYNSLAGSGWNNISRAAALLALRKRLNDAGRTDEGKAIDPRIVALGLDKDDGQAALNLRDDLEN